MAEPLFATAADSMARWADDIRTGKGPTLFPVGVGDLARLEIGPGLLVLLGGAPGAGKTALVMQLVTDALRTTSTIKALVTNVEMSVDSLLDRQLSRLSGIPLQDIRHRRIEPESQHRLEKGLVTLADFADRLAFVNLPPTLDRIAGAADEFGADILVLDYIQRIAPRGDHTDRRAAVDATMGHLRMFAEAGRALLVVSAVGRGKDTRGRNSYSGDSLSLASFKESGELEYGADSAYLLVPDEKSSGRTILRCLKNRHGDTQDIRLTFDGSLQRFGTSGNDDNRRERSRERRGD